jgi:hypothetical protein
LTTKEKKKRKKKRKSEVLVPELWLVNVILIIFPFFNLSRVSSLWIVALQLVPGLARHNYALQGSRDDNGWPVRSMQLLAGETLVVVRFTHISTALFLLTISLFHFPFLPHCLSFPTRDFPLD